VRDLQDHRGACLIVPGEQQPLAVHALAHAMNDALGNVGKTVTFTAPVEANPQNQMDSLRDLVSAMQGGQVEALLILGVNPVYDAPADLRFGENLLRVKTRIHLSAYEDETAVLCHWHIPEAHYLEAWSDVRAYDGTTSIIQPLISPLYDGKSAHEVLSVLAGQGELTGHEIVRRYWQQQRPGANFESFWQQSLNDGVVSGTALPVKTVKLNAAGLSSADITPRSNAGNTLELVLRPDPSVGDGHLANNAWLQELPKPITKLTWDNAALLSPATAIKLHVGNGDFLKLRNAAGELEVPAFITPGHAADSITVHLGYGRTRAGRVGSGIGFNAYRLRSSSEPWFTSVEAQKTGRTYQLVTTQQHHIVGKEGQQVEEESVAERQRGLVKVATLDEFRKEPNFAREKTEENAPSIYPAYKYEGYSWGMAIDNNACIGCNACVVACQSENNIPIVGKDQVARGREMHWIRVDSYFHGGLANPEVYHEVVPCMHCENAPCEYVCPVGATVHSPEGLNEMIYNRCVGTRYCSNNCPYKVRRFNFYLFSDWDTPSLKGLRNPEVTVRSRGVMEKCTYCIQRINAVKFAAEKEDREIRDGEILTACQQTCPTQAIVFGNINDPNSKVSKLKAQSRNYSLLADLNARPRTTYLARLRNPNSEL
jgi:molybdopterin-containing oxidoreductase family iron-sulfur binding subunit